MSNSKKVALITGITGQDGAYLSEFLLEKGYDVHGIKRSASSFNTERIDHLYNDRNIRFNLHYGDLTDSTNLIRIIQLVQPDEIYNLAAQSHVAVSFETPEYTANADALGTLRLLEAIRIPGLERKQSSTRHPPMNYLVKSRKYLRRKQHLFILAAHMLLQNYTYIGFVLTIVKHMVYMPVTTFYSIMNHLFVAKQL